MKQLLIAVCLLLTLQATAQSTQIRIANFTRDIAPDTTGTITFTVDFNVPISEQFLLASSDLETLAESYKNIYPIFRVYEQNDTAYCSFRKSYTVSIRKADGSIIDDAYLQEFLEGKYLEFEYGLSNFQPMPFDAIIGRKFINGEWH